MKQPTGSNPVRIFAASVIAKHLQSLRAELPGVTANQDIEAVHRTRVATRRLRAAFDIFDAHLPQKKKAAWFAEFRRLARSLGAARDADVQLGVLAEVLAQSPDPAYNPGLRRILLRTRQQRTRQQDTVLAAITDLENSETLNQLDLFVGPLVEQALPALWQAPALLQLACQAVSARMAEFLAFEADLIYPERVNQLHQMRIAGKRLRYTMETFAVLYPNELKPQLQILRQAQDSLGLIHDCDVWTDALPRFIEKESLRVERYFGNSRPLKRLLPGFQYFIENRHSVRASQYQQFLADWQNWDANDAWETLLNIVRTPTQLKPVE